LTDAFNGISIPLNKQKKTPIAAFMEFLLLSINKGGENANCCMKRTRWHARGDQGRPRRGGREWAGSARPAALKLVARTVRRGARRCALPSPTGVAA
jgi:hypothetical protein